VSNCPTCHQPFAVERLGVRLTPLKAALFDRIKCAGDIGVSSTELVGELYDNLVVVTLDLAAEIVAMAERAKGITP
jgi:hypothetical protein